MDKDKTIKKQGNDIIVSKTVIENIPIDMLKERSKYISDQIVVLQSQLAEINDMLGMK